MPAPALPVAAFLIAGIWLWRLRIIRDLHTLPPRPWPSDKEFIPGESN